MSTDYYIKAEGGDLWPEEGAPSYQRDLLWRLVDQQQPLARLARIGDLNVTLTGCYGGDLLLFMAEHTGLTVVDEYGRAYPRPIAAGA